jgi:hypothetical protein
MRRGLALGALLVAAAPAGCATQGSSADRADPVARTATTRPATAPATATTARAATTRARRAEAHAPHPPPHRGPPARHVAPVPAPVPDPPRSEIESTAATGVSPGAPSDAQVRQELAEAMHLAGGTSSRRLTEAAGLTAGGLAVTPPAAPDVVDAVIRGGNRVAHAPYVYGGGHGTFEDSAYDCSGSVSFALASAGLLGRPLDSGALERWGRAGPGRWITVYANAGHAWMTVAGLRFDTSGRTGDRGSRWQLAQRAGAGFVARHPPGL